MVDIAGLMKALPVSALMPKSMAILDGIVQTSAGSERWKNRIVLLEPPAGRRLPFIEPVGTLEKVLLHLGTTSHTALAQAHEATARMKQQTAANHRARYFDPGEPESPECLPVTDFLDWLLGELPAASAIAGFLQQATEVACATPLFRSHDRWDQAACPRNRTPLSRLPTRPHPKAMFGFFHAPWCIGEGERDDWNAPFLAWREKMRPIACDLERTLGKRIYAFDDRPIITDDPWAEDVADFAHRFLILHWCCAYRPNSGFVRYLLAASEADSVEALQAALIDPASYAHSFELGAGSQDRTFGAIVFDYLPETARKTVGVAFCTEAAREVASTLLMQQLGAHAFVVAPEALATDAWIKQATPYCRGWRVRYVHDGRLDDPIGILATVDELWVVADEPTPNPGIDLKLSEPMEDLLWLAIDLKVESHYYFTDGWGLSNPERALHERQVPPRAAARQAQRAAFTRQLREVRLDNDYGSSGLWDEEGEMLGYDLLDLPFPLARRIAAWQQDYDDTVTPPGKGSDAWWDRHEDEAVEIAQELQTALGENTVVKLHRKQGWMSVDEVRPRRGTP